MPSRWVGAEMVPVMHDTPLDTLYPLVISMDAMIFSGGCDIDPVHYGCSREAGCGRIDPRRDQTELALFDLVFGCKHTGSGHLPWHTADQRRPWRYAQAGTYPAIVFSETSDDPVWHDVRLEPGSRLAALAGAPSARVNSYHHQVLDRVADGLGRHRPLCRRRDRGRGDAGGTLLCGRAVAPGEVPEGRRLFRQHLQSPARGHALSAQKNSPPPCRRRAVVVALQTDVFFQQPGAEDGRNDQHQHALQERWRQRLHIKAGRGHL